MAQRTTRCSLGLVLAAGLLARTAMPLPRTQLKEGISVPLCSRHLASDGAERLVDTLSELKAVFQHGDGDRIIFIAFDKLSARSREAGIGSPRSSESNRLGLHGLLWRAEA